MIEERW